MRHPPYDGRHNSEAKGTVRSIDAAESRPKRFWLRRAGLRVVVHGTNRFISGEDFLDWIRLPERQAVPTAADKGGSSLIKNRELARIAHYVDRKRPLHVA